MRDSSKVNLYMEHIYIYKDDVYRIIKNVFGDDFVTDDLTQIVMMNAWKGLHNLKDVKKSKQWVKAITRNVIREHMKKRTEYFTVEELDLVNDIERHEEIHQIEKDILEIIMSKEEFSDMGAALRSLDPVYQTIIRQHVLGEIPLKEISRNIGINYGTVRVMYARGMRLLRDRYQKLVKGGELDG